LDDWENLILDEFFSDCCDKTQWSSSVDKLDILLIPGLQVGGTFE